MTESVTKRNDPCPCGSGKKFKKCCMTKPETRENGLLNLLNQEFERVNQNLYSFSRNNFRGKLDRYINTLCSTHAIPYTQREVVKDYSYIWSLFHLPVQGTSTTFDLYLEGYQKEAKRETAVRMLTEWKESHFSIYRISEITDSRQMVLKDIWLDKTYTVPILTGHQPPALDNLIMGMIVPIYENAYDFILGYAQIESRLFTDEKLKAIHETYLSQPGQALEDQLDQSLPLIFIELLSGENHPLNPSLDESPVSEKAYLETVKQPQKLNFQGNENEQLSKETTSMAKVNNDLAPFNGSDSQLKALKLFMNRKDPSTVTQVALDETTHLWQTFVEAQNPSIKKPEAYAAALDYWASNRTAQGLVTQAGISKKYGVSSATVSKNFRLLDEFFNQNFPQDIQSNERELVGVSHS
jgi:uncharacterized protein